MFEKGLKALINLWVGITLDLHLLPPGIGSCNVLQPAAHSMKQNYQKIFLGFPESGNIFAIIN